MKNPAARIAQLLALAASALTIGSVHEAEAATLGAARVASTCGIDLLPLAGLRCVTVDASSFPGRKVVAKIWYARVGDLPDWWAVPEWRVLARGDGSPVLGRGLPIENRAWTASYLAGLVS